MADAGTRAAFTRGFWVLAPLWLGVIPFGLAYAVTARSAGLSLVETQALSVLVFAGSAQFSAVGLFAVGAAGLEIILTTLLLNVRHVLYGLSLGRELELTPRERPVAAFFLTDEAFGVVAGAKERSFPFLLGAELSLFLVWTWRRSPATSSGLRSPIRRDSGSTSSSRSRFSPCSCRFSTPGSSSSSRSPRAPWRSGSHKSSRVDCRSC